MAEDLTKKSNADNPNTVSDKSDSDEKSARKAKRLAQHQHWMRVMMEGQSTPDLRYQRPKD